MFNMGYGIAGVLIALLLLVSGGIVLNEKLDEIDDASN